MLYSFNGPFNTFLRNRAESYGIFFSASNSPDQNFLGNDITNTSFPYSLVNYSIQGSGHFIHGNSDKGDIDPAGTSSLADLSYAYDQKPDFVPSGQWAAIGTPNSPGTASIPSRDRLLSNSVFEGSCSSYSLGTAYFEFDNGKGIKLFPNPTESTINIKSKELIKEVLIMNQIGQIQFLNKHSDYNYSVNLTQWSKGVYMVKIRYKDDDIELRKIIKI